MPRSINLHPNLAAFLDTIAYSEGVLKFGNDDGYNVCVGGSLFTYYAKHPRKSVVLNKAGLTSDAAGRYQLMGRYYKHYIDLLNLSDFKPESQDRIAIQLIKEQKALADITAGKFKTAIDKCRNIWASFPGAGYGQHENKLNDLLTFYISKGGTCNE